jgi:hypothetical protein
VDRYEEAALVTGDPDEVHSRRILPDVELLHGADLISVLGDNLAALGVLPMLLEFTLEVVQLDEIRASVSLSHKIYPPFRRSVVL